jgi:RNA polymerase sigma-70 factor (family 1)
MREKEYHILSESEILTRLRQGDEAAFSALFYNYKDKLYDFILGLTRSEHEAEDGVQDVFMKIWQNRDHLQEVDNLNAYLYGIARNQIIDAVRRFARNITAIGSLLDEQKEHAVATPIEDILSKEMNDALDEAIAQLSPQQRRAFQMRKLQGKSQSEIGEALHVSASTATGYTKDAVKNVRTYLLAHYPELFVIVLACYLDHQ